jgi:diguanylate cyclase (GGDEF)-like protein
MAQTETNPSDRSRNPAEAGLLHEAGLTRWRGVWRPAIVRTLLMAAGVAAVAGAAKLLTIQFQEQSPWILRITLAVSMVGLVFTMSLRHRQQWALPADDMRRLIREIRIGRAPIEEFAALSSGQLRSVAEEVKNLLQDLRHQRQAVEELNHEVRQRIANRTNVLERTINALRNQAVKDPLTGLYNRRMLDQFLPQLITHCQSSRRPLTLLMFDMYRFKELNDSVGRMAGDEVLRSVGQIIHSTIREGDVAFRYGGDDFVVVLPGCEPAAAKRVIERLQSLVQALATGSSGLKTLAARPRLSIGISTLSELDEPTATNLLQRADQRLAESTAAKRRAEAPAPSAAQTPATA